MAQLHSGRSLNRAPGRAGRTGEIINIRLPDMTEILGFLQPEENLTDTYN